MATYKYVALLTESQDDVFDDTYRQGSITFHSGIYRCMDCEAEIALAGGLSRAQTISTVAVIARLEDRNVLSGGCLCGRIEAPPSGRRSEILRTQGDHL
jgi:hypothetical protein